MRKEKKEGEKGKLFFIHCVWYEGWKIEGKKDDRGKVVNKIVPSLFLFPSNEMKAMMERK